MTPEQEKLKLFMILKYGDLRSTFWSDIVVTPEENRILELYYESITDNVDVKRKNAVGDASRTSMTLIAGDRYAYTMF